MILRGQVTLEYILVSLVILSLLSISVFSLMKIKDGSDNMVKIMQFKSDALSVYNAAADVCALGKGNSRVVSISTPMTVSFEANGKLLVFGYNGNEIVKTLECPLPTLTQDLATGKLTIENLDGEIEIT